MEAIAQAFTFGELDAVRIALSSILQDEEQLPIATELMETAFEKIDRVTDDMRCQLSNNTYFLIIPVELEEITEEQ